MVDIIDQIMSFEVRGPKGGIQRYSPRPDGPPRREIDIDLFRKIKRALQLKKARKFYKSEQQVAQKFRLGTTTISLIGKSRSFAEYRRRRRAHSKPEVYTDEPKRQS